MTSPAEELKPKFVEYIPKTLEQGILYVSVEYTTTAHQCACGCGEKVILPLHPTDWRLTFDGKHITMRPSVGNWGFPCRSHYLITGSQIVWAGDWTESQIIEGRKRCDRHKASWHGEKRLSPSDTAHSPGHEIGRLARILRSLLSIIRR